VPDLEQRLRDAAPDRERMPRELEERIWVALATDAPAHRAARHRRRRIGRPLIAFVAVALVLAGAVLAVLLRHPSTSAPPTSHPRPPAPRAAGTVFFAYGPNSNSLSLYRMQPDGTGLLRLVSGVSDAYVSPDGRLVQYARQTAHGAFQLVIQPLSGGRPLVVTQRHGRQVGTGEWSPDGTRIAFEGTNGIYTLRASDGGDLRRITHAGPFADFPVAYSPDGTRILFMRTASPGDQTQAPMNLFSVNVDGSGLVRLNPQGTLTGMTWPVRSAGWSPDGRRIVFVAGSAGLYAAGASVYVANADGTHARSISDAGALFASWSPDGNWIAYDVGPHHESFVSHPDGTRLRQLTGIPAGGVFTWAGVWAPDSRSVLIQRGQGCDANGCDDLWTVPIDGSGMRQVTHRRGDYESYRWLTTGP
jgi:Tol biopolymer transport system component